VIVVNVLTERTKVSSKFLLPCLCGQQVPIEPRQAGETIACRCGASLQAPTMREICALEPAPAEPSLPRATATWGWRHGLRLLGAVTVLLAVGWGIWLYLNPPYPDLTSSTRIDPAERQQNAPIGHPGTIGRRRKRDWIAASTKICRPDDGSTTSSRDSPSSWQSSASP